MRSYTHSFLMQVDKNNYFMGKTADPIRLDGSSCTHTPQQNMSHRQVTHWPAEVKKKTLWGKRPWTKLQVLFRSGLCRIRMGFPMSILIAVAVPRSEIQLTKNVRPLKGSRSQLHDVLWTELGETPYKQPC